jgi:hypothetical protein
MDQAEPAEPEPCYWCRAPIRLGERVVWLDGIGWMAHEICNPKRGDVWGEHERTDA